MSINTDKDSHMGKPEIEHLDIIAEAAVDGHVACDAHGNPIVEIDHKAEARLRRKLDLHVIPPVFIMYLLCYIDRANIGNARLAGFEADLNLVRDVGPYGYNLLLTAFYIAYVVFELPMNYGCKILGPKIWLPLLTFGFGLFSMVTGFVHSFGPAFAVRFLLGIAEAGLFPGILYYLTRWYRKDELAFRISLFLCGTPLAGAFGGLLASAILKIDHIGWLTRWRTLFFLEGLATMLVGMVCYFVTPDRPETCKWLNADEKALCSTRIKSENVGQTQVLDNVSGKVIRRSIFNPTTLIIGLTFTAGNIVVQGLGFFMPTVIRTIYPGRSTVEIQLRTVPPYIFGAFTTLLLPYFAWKTKRRAIYMVCSAPLIVVGYAIFLGTKSPNARYGGIFLVTMGSFCSGVLTNTWASINTTSDTGRAATSATVVLLGNIGGLIATWSYLPQHAPNYIPGNALNTANGVLMTVLPAGLWLYHLRENRRKVEGRDDHYLAPNEETGEVQDEALLGQKHPGFRFRN